MIPRAWAGTIFVAIVMLWLSYSFSKDTNIYVVEPVERMSVYMRKLADDSLCRCLISDDDDTQKLETQVRAPTSARRRRMGISTPSNHRHPPRAARVPHSWAALVRAHDMR